MNYIMFRLHFEIVKQIKAYTKLTVAMWCQMFTRKSLR